MTACLQGYVMLRPLKPIRSAAVNSSGSASGPDAQLADVDQLVDVTDALLGALALVHGWRAGALNAIADQAGEEAGLAGLRHADRLPNEDAMAAWCRLSAAFRMSTEPPGASPSVPSPERLWSNLAGR